MGVQGAGKTTLAAEWIARGYERLNRDERSGSMADLHRALEARLAAGVLRLVLDNTYTTRAGRQLALEAARRHRARVRAVWLETPGGRRPGEYDPPHARDARASPRTGRDGAGARSVVARARGALPFDAGGGGALFRRGVFVARGGAVRSPAARRTGARRGVHRARRGRKGGASDRRSRARLRVETGRHGRRVRADAGRIPRAGEMLSTSGRTPAVLVPSAAPGAAPRGRGARGVDLGRSVVVGTKAVHAATARALGASYRAT